MLFEQFGGRSVEDIFMNPSQFHPFPLYEEREQWEGLNPVTRRKWIAEAEKHLDYNWPATTMYNYRVYALEGNFYPHWLAFTEKRTALGVFLIAECMEGQGRFIQQIINGIYALCECTTWMPPVNDFNDNEGIPDENHFIVDLNTSETAALLAWTYYLMKNQLDSIGPRICRRIYNEIEKRVIKPYTQIDDYWWMGFVDCRINNWNPWCNMNVIMCHLLMDFGSEERQKGLTRIAKSLDRYLETYPADGGCDEGPMYWGAAGGGFNICLELLQSASRGQINLFHHDKVKKMGSYFYKVFIDGTYFVDYADGDPIVPLFPTVYTYGKNIGDDLLLRLGASAPPLQIEWKNWFHTYQYLMDIFTEEERSQVKGDIPYIKDAWLDHIQVMTAREQAGTPKGLFLSAKAGSNVESHNHNDIGNFIVYLDGKPLFIDIGTEEYKAQTFSPRRFELWYLQSQYHNCPTINNVLQHDGKDYFAEQVSYSQGETSMMQMELQKAYTEDAGIIHWKRSIGLTGDSQSYVLVVDDFALDKESPVTYNFMSHKQPVKRDDGIEIDLGGSVGVLAYDQTNLETEIEEIKLLDLRTRRNWGENIYRIVLREKQLVQSAKRAFRIFSR